MAAGSHEYIDDKRYIPSEAWLIVIIMMPAATLSKQLR